MEQISCPLFAEFRTGISASVFNRAAYAFDQRGVICKGSEFKHSQSIHSLDVENSYFRQVSFRSFKILGAWFLCRMLLKTSPDGGTECFPSRRRLYNLDSSLLFVL